MKYQLPIVFFKKIGPLKFTKRTWKWG